MCRRCFRKWYLRRKKNVFRAVDYSDLPYFTLQAIRELKVANDRLREEVEQFEQPKSEIKTLRAEIEELKAP